MTIPPSEVSISTPGDAPKKAKVWPWFAGALALVLLDQGTKLAVRHYLTPGQPVPFIGKSLVRLTYVQNPGIAFGMEIFGLTPLLVFGWIAGIALSFYLFRLVRRRDILRWPVMLFVAGAFGNSIDRLLLGKVTDFVDVDMPDFIMERFAVFNVADSCITVGIVLLAIIVLFVQRKTEEGAQVSASAVLTAGDSIGNSDLNVQSSNPTNSLPSDHGGPPATRSD
jgi:signal peptidase II